MGSKKASNKKGPAPVSQEPAGKVNRLRAYEGGFRSTPNSGEPPPERSGADPYRLQYRPSPRSRPIAPWSHLRWRPLPQRLQNRLAAGPRIGFAAEVAGACRGVHQHGLDGRLKLEIGRAHV